MSKSLKRVRAALEAAGLPPQITETALARTAEDAQTGFAIGGVSPVGHLSPIQCFFDRRLMDFDVIWAAAGTPHHVFQAEPAELARICDGQVSDFT